MIAHRTALFTIQAFICKSLIPT